MCVASGSIRREERRPAVGMKPARRVDARGLNCPMPIIRLAKEMEFAERNEVIEISADDPAFETDLRAWCKVTKNELLEVVNEGNVTMAYVRKV